jgi:ParB family chromosome partitioning protein
MILPSEKAFAYKMKLEARKRQQGERTDLTSATTLQKLRKEQSSREELAENSPDSHEQIRKYIRLTELIPPLLEAADNKAIAGNPDMSDLAPEEEAYLTLALNAAVEVSYLTGEEQEILRVVMERDECSPTQAQARKLRKMSEAQRLDEKAVSQLLNDDKPFERKFLMRDDKLKKYFPPTYTAKQIEAVVIGLLDGWHKKRQREEQARGER